MKTYNFKVVQEPDEDFDGNPSGFHAFCPALESQGASTWGATEGEALKTSKASSAWWSRACEPIPEVPADAEIYLEWGCNPLVPIVARGVQDNVDVVLLYFGIYPGV
jgi:hypothetical protein